ncbi:MAG: prepilin-type N-terminal cleavage/methylation domain-containing protein, partial [Planctomycetota bacterium]
MIARRGFTLIEVILSVTLTLGLLLAVYSMYGQVMDLREGLSADAAELAVRRNLM